MDAISQPTSVGQRSRIKIWLVAAGLALIAVAILVAVVQKQPAVAEHSIAVMPARWVWPSEDFPAIRHDEDLAERIAANLANRYGVPVISWPSLQRFRAGNVSTRKIAAELGIDRMLIVSVRVEADGFRVTSFLIDPKVDRKMKGSDKRHVSLSTPSDREAVATEIAANFSATK